MKVLFVILAVVFSQSATFIGNEFTKDNYSKNSTKATNCKSSLYRGMRPGIISRNTRLLRKIDRRRALGKRYVQHGQLCQVVGMQRKMQPKRLQHLLHIGYIYGFWCHRGCHNGCSSFFNIFISDIIFIRWGTRNWTIVLSQRSLALSKLLAN